MRSISASEAKQNFAALVDAAQREPVVICRHDREVAVLVSRLDFEAFWPKKDAAPAPAGEDVRGQKQVMGEIAALMKDLDSGG
jgi:prevent-host-death family protein